MTSVPCSECHEPISSEAKTCPHCGDKKWHTDRYHEYLLLIAPVAAVLLGIVFYAIINNSHPVLESIWALPATIIVIYALVAALTWEQRKQHLEHIQEHTRSKP